MKRDIDMKEVSDGKLYTSSDLAKLGCSDCAGCSDCCQGMGQSIILDPYDIYQLTKGLNCTFNELLQDKIELSVVDGLILPNLALKGESEVCGFLNEEGRCSIHAIRPGFCRLFPLGRIYEDNTFHYFLQIHECKKENRTKVKISKWLGIPKLKQYEQFVTDWHYFLNNVEDNLKEMQDEQQIKNAAMGLVKLFYLMPYDFERDFYEQFYERKAMLS
ncbi:MAG: YkgJ family cysteine cluster protein [Ruminococcus sp.]|nr:YkgJ family cysteine cluster protein [Ruminococcus sp.]